MNASVAVAVSVGLEEHHNGLPKICVSVLERKQRPMIKIGAAGELKPREEFG
jgi:hypothetical protein